MKKVGNVMEQKAKSAVIGFPRIGKNRELKFASEKFFKGECSLEELNALASSIREYGWKRQKESDLDFIPSGDFSFYDNMLDAAFLLGAVPDRYRELGLGSLETYFAMAHGYQGKGGDVKALPMKKWFNTNYHYLVPELSANSVLSADSKHNKFLEEFLEAKSKGYDTIPTVIGPYTFLRLASYRDGARREQFVSSAVAAYSSVICSLNSVGAGWVSLQEPALVIDMSNADVSLFLEIYRNLISSVRSSCGVKVLLQTYFGDIRDIYGEVCGLGFDGIGLDFFEGEKTLSLVQRSFPKNALLFAGIISGKNIWKSDYGKKKELLCAIEKLVPKENIVLSSSCSLLHVPYTTSLETQLSKSVLDYFSFAEEKLLELNELSHVFAGGAKEAEEKNAALFSRERIKKDTTLRQAVASLSDKDFIRQPDFYEREKIQHKALNLPVLPTTTIGSFPQTKEVRANRAGYKKGSVSKEDYIQFNKNKISECIRLQEEIGLDVLVHGEFERNDMVEYFGNNLNGYVFTNFGWVQSYGTRCVKPPVIWGDISRKGSITVEWSVFAQSQTKKPLKGMLTGPVTILNWSFPREDLSLKEQAFQIALAIREEVLDLEKNGIRIIQIDEAALREKLPLRKADWHSLYLDWAIPAFRIVHAKVKPQTQIHTHMCYSEFNDIIGDIDSMDADVITFEASRGDLRILDALSASNFKTEVGPGVYDIHSARVPSVEEITDALEKMLTRVPLEKLWVNPDCGLKTRGEEETVKSLRNLVDAAKLLREKVSK